MGGNKASLPSFKMFFPLPRRGRGKKTRESKETLVSRRKSLAIFDGRRRVPRKFYEFSGDREEKIEDRSEKSMLFSERSSIFSSQREKGRTFSRYFSDSERVGGNIRKRTLVCRRKSLAILDGRRRVPSDSEEIGGDARLPSKIASDFRRQTAKRKIFDEGGPIFDRAPLFDFFFHGPPRESHEWIRGGVP